MSSRFLWIKAGCCIFLVDNKVKNMILETHVMAVSVITSNVLL